MTKKHSYKALMGAFLCLLLLLTACGKDDEKSEKKSESEPKKEITLTDAMGEVKIPADPKRILASNLEDSLVALDVTPAAQWAIGTSVHDYLQPYLKDVPTIEWNMPLEQTINADPELIIFSSPSAIEEGKYEEYKKIAPTYVFKDEDAADWRKQLQIMGQIVDKEDKAKEVLADYDKKAEQAAKEIKTSIGDESAAVIWVIAKQYYLLESNRYAGNVLYNDLGITQPKMIQDLPPAEASWNPIALEALTELDADHIFLASLPGEDGLQALKDSSVWKGLPAVKNNQVYDMEDPSNWTINGKIASDVTIDNVLKALK